MSPTYEQPRYSIHLIDIHGKTIKDISFTTKQAAQRAYDACLQQLSDGEPTTYTSVELYELPNTQDFD